MNLKIFYSPPKWMAFIAPEKRAFSLKAKRKPLMGIIYFEAHERVAYEKAYAEAKANALEVGNPEMLLNKDGVCFVPKSEVPYPWRWKAVIKDGKYILSI